MPVAITKENFDTEIAQSPVPCIIEVFATWCGPCKQMEPTFEKLEKKLGVQYKFAKLNVDEAREISIQYGVTSVPTFIFIKNNEVVRKATGYINEADLESLIDQHLAQ